MNTTASKTTDEVKAFQNQAEMINEFLRINVKGLTHEDSLMQPHPGGNCLNWVVGHLLWAYNYNLPVIGQKPLVEENLLKNYKRGTPPLEDEDEALNFNKLIDLWEDTAEAFDTGLNNLNTDALSQPVKRVPDDESDETVRERITGVLFHQSYHVGQTGLLRRFIGKDGAIE